MKFTKLISDILKLPLARANFEKSNAKLAVNERKAGASPRRGGYVAKQYKDLTDSQLTVQHLERTVQPVIDMALADQNIAVADLEFEMAFKRGSYSPAKPETLAKNVYGLASDPMDLPDEFFFEQADTLIQELSTDGIQLQSLRLDSVDVVAQSFKAGRKAGHPFHAKWGDVWEVEDLSDELRHYAGMTTKEIAVREANRDPSLLSRPWSEDRLIIVIGTRITPGGYRDKSEPYKLLLDLFNDQALDDAKVRAITMPDAIFNIGVGMYSDPLTRALSKLRQFDSWTDLWGIMVPQMKEDFDLAQQNGYKAFSMDYGTYDQTVTRALLLAVKRVILAFFQVSAHKIINETFDYLIKEKWILTPDFEKTITPGYVLILESIAKVMSGVKSTSILGTLGNRILSTRLDQEMGIYDLKRSLGLYNRQLGDDTVLWVLADFIENLGGDEHYFAWVEDILSRWGMVVNRYKQWKHLDSAHFLQILFYRDVQSNKVEVHYPVARIILAFQERFSSGDASDGAIAQIQQVSLTANNLYGHDLICKELLMSDDMLLALIQSQGERYEQVLIDGIGGVEALVAKAGDFVKGSGGQAERARKGVYPIWEASPMLIEQARSLPVVDLSWDEIMKIFKDRTSELVAQESGNADEEINFE